MHSIICRLSASSAIAASETVFNDRMVLSAFARVGLSLDGDQSERNSPLTSDALCRHSLRMARCGRFDLLGCWLLRVSRLHRGSVRHVARESLSKTALVVRIDLRIIASARHCYISPNGDSRVFLLPARRHMHGTRMAFVPAAMAGHCIAVVEMRIFFDVECDRPA